MGVEFYLADTKGRRRFHLGKGGWSEWYRSDELPATPEAMCDGVAGGLRVAPDDTLSPWGIGLACRIWGFVESCRATCELRNDAADPEDENGPGEWIDVGSRYGGDVDPDPLAAECARHEAEARVKLGLA